MVVIERGKRPKKPPNAQSLGFSDTLWELVFRCWDESPASRPTAQQLLHCLRDASRTWVSPPEYPVSDDLDEGVEFEFASGIGRCTVVGALASGLLAFIIGVLCVLI